MSRDRKKYSKEFKEQAIALSEERGNVRLASEELGIDPAQLYSWRSQSKKYGKKSFPGQGKPLETEQEAEIRRLKKELSDAKMERDILKKAISIFS